MNTVALSPSGLKASTRTTRLARVHLLVFVASAASAGLAALVASHLIVNRTPSLPLGLYWLSPGKRPERGELAAFPVPASVRELVAERHYLPQGAMLVKHVLATAGDEVCTSGGMLTISRAPYGQVLFEDTAGRPLPHFEGCGPLPDGMLFLGSPYDKSFDSRTFGPVPIGSVRGTVRPLWIF